MYNMNRIFVLSALLSLLISTYVSAQDTSSITSAPSSLPTTFISITPEMSASSVSSFFNALATATPLQPGDGALPGDVGSAPAAGDSDAGAEGNDDNSLTISREGIIAIIVVCSVVVLFGIASSVLWYIAKKRSWEVRKTIRRSAKRVKTALTPRRSTFPKDVMQKRSSRGLQKIDEIPPTPRLTDFDIEKGNRTGNSTKISSFELSEPPKKSKWARQTDK